MNYIFGIIIFILILLKIKYEQLPYTMIDYPIFNIFIENKNEESAPKMAAYMKNKFEFLGINSPTRKLLQKEFIRELSKNKPIDWNFVLICFEKQQREFQYLAIDYLISLKKYTQKDDIEVLQQLIQTKSWWDSVDVVAPKLMAQYFKEFPQERNQKVEEWIASKNIWLIRSAILFQLKYKKETDLPFLFKLILRVSHTKEFFINKAIGWILRENAKTNPRLITEFIETNTNNLSNLSIREGLKHVG